MNTALDDQDCSDYDEDWGGAFELSLKLLVKDLLWFGTDTAKRRAAPRVRFLLVSDEEYSKDAVPEGVFPCWPTYIFSKKLRKHPDS